MQDVSRGTLAVSGKSLYRLNAQTAPRGTWRDLDPRIAKVFHVEHCDERFSRDARRGTTSRDIGGYVPRGTLGGHGGVQIVEAEVICSTWNNPGQSHKEHQR